MVKIKKNLSRELKRVLDVLVEKFPHLNSLNGTSWTQVSDFKEIERRDDRVFFGAEVDVPKIFEDTLFKELGLVIRITRIPKFNVYNESGKDYYWAQVSWNYEHPGCGRNGYSFCDVSLDLDGSLSSVRCEKDPR